jgi:uncharacterized membrane protein
VKTISGLFDNYDEARLAVYGLEDAGIPADDISIISLNKTPGDSEDDSSTKAASVGAAVGGVGGLLAGLAAFAIPGVGQVMGAGWVATAFIGAAAGGVAGGLIGSLVDGGIDESDAHVFAEGVKRGGALVTARVEESEYGRAAAVLKGLHPVDVASRRREYEQTGWAGFVVEDIWDSDIGNEDK